MKRLFLVLTLALGVSGCAALQKLEEIAGQVAGTTVSPQQLYIAANAFDAAKTGTSTYFRACAPFVNLKTHKAFATAPAACSDNNRRTVFSFIHAGTPARDQAETYLATGASAPIAIYNTLVAAVNGLKSTASTPGAAQ